MIKLSQRVVVNLFVSSHLTISEGYDVFKDSEYGSRNGYCEHTPLSLLSSEEDGFLVGDRLEVKVSVRVEK